DESSPGRWRFHQTARDILKLIKSATARHLASSMQTDAASRRKVKEACLRCICEGGYDMVMTGSMAKYTKGNLLLIDDRPIRYAMSNTYEIGATWPKSYDRVVIGKNGPYVLACFRAEGEDASWWYMPHDEYLLLVEGEVRVDYIEPREDRKSTRLNSSHVAISYAVFCLKK